MKFRFYFLVAFFALLSVSNGYAQRGNEKPKDYDFAKASTENLTKMLSLDGFQSAAIKTFMDEYKKDMEAMGRVEMPTEARAENHKIINQKLESKIMGVLNSEQKVLYENEKNKKDKKKKKSKDRKIEEIESSDKL